MKFEKRRFFQQGDVLFFLEEELPENLERKVFKGAVVFAEGESTGHAHTTAVDSFIETYTDADENLWANLLKPKVVQHQEHAPVTLPPGTYRVGIVREPDPFTEEIKSVTD